MGNYLFNAEALVRALRDVHARGRNDFGEDVLPRLIKTHRVFAYDFATNHVPRTKPYETHPYWRDVGTIDAYYAAHKDFLGLEPHFDEFNVEWPIYTGNYLGPAAKIYSGEVRNSVLAGGSLICDAAVRDSVVRCEVLMHQDVEVDECIIMDYTVIGKGSRLRGAIVDRYNVIPPGTVIGYDREADAARYHVSSGGIVTVPVGQRGVNLVY
jgi:glucose-1-phosphate adenylyltransferase